MKYPARRVDCRNCVHLSVWPNRYDRCYVHDVQFVSEYKYSEMAESCEDFEEEK